MKLRTFCAIAAATLPLLSAGCARDESQQTAALVEAVPAPPEALGEIVGLRRLTEAQYRNAIADIFGPDITVAGRFEPIVRPTHHLIATGAGNSALSPAGLEQFDAIARSISAQVFGERHRAAFLKCAPKAENLPDAACAAKVLMPLGRYLYRRPMTAAELAGYVGMANVAAEKSGSFYSGLELALGAMLVSPNFLYVVESAEPDPEHPGQKRLDAYSRASRLSFLLWNTTPSESLLAAAQSGALLDQAQLSAIAEKMVASPRLEQGVRAFFGDMLLFEKFDEIAKDPLVYPRFNQEVARALPEQMLRTIVDQLVTRRGDYRELFTTRRTFVNRALGPLYNVPVQSRTGWEPIEFAESDGRAGLLSQAGFLALYAHSGRSSPTLRGRAIRELLLCQPVPDPPGNVNFTAVQDTNNAILKTARQRLTAHATDPSCSGCHRITDPIGLPLEKFDGIGGFRAKENGAEIDTSGSFEGTAFIGAGGLGKALATNPSTTECLAGRAMEYATGRSMDEEGELVAELEKAFAGKGYRFPDLMLMVATLPTAYRIPKPPEVLPELTSRVTLRSGAAR